MKNLKPDSNFLLFTNIKRNKNVDTSEMLKNALNKCGVKTLSVKVRAPNSSNYNTDYATVILDPTLISENDRKGNKAVEA